ncbi:GYDIA family GHMP kinase [Empedobacter falsenii]|uniref:Mevalonate kinase n=1 Tax=Empedobacter falsenii TaxID=343874 RepID=A0A376G742_9FLAO|nr:GYDIA family GHMP kinase [Empedobacter falsenii]STD55488.1 mevalonate kinase [Empedobacter falsenii]
MKTYRSNGKLFLIGEYIVIDGAKAFALPTKYGQCLFVENSSEIENLITWKAIKFDNSIWFETEIRLNDLEIISSTNDKLSQSLQNVLKQAKILNPDFFDSNNSYQCLTKLEYPQEWGLGSSSTLIDLISQWIEINPFELNQLTFNTSGYDIACAHHHQPILFSNNPIEVEDLELNWNFKDQLYFVYLNQKQDTQAVVGNHYKNKPKDWKMIQDLSDLVVKATKVENLTDLESILDEYQARLGDFMQIPQVKELYFPDYLGTVKSLGAWGGDFVLVTYREGMNDYFKEKGYEIIIPFSEMIK